MLWHGAYSFGTPDHTRGVKSTDTVVFIIRQEETSVYFVWCPRVLRITTNSKTNNGATLMQLCLLLLHV